MPLPDDVKDDALGLVATYCATQIPSEHADEIRAEYTVRGNTITIHRAPAAVARGPWPRLDLDANLLDGVGPATRLWTLYARDRNDRRLDYPHVAPAPSLKPLIQEVDNDPTGIFWG